MDLHELEKCEGSHPMWIGSFFEKLIEYGVWDEDEFWKLHKNLVGIAVALKNDVTVEKSLLSLLLRIQKCLNDYLIYHLDKESSYSIKNVSTEKLFQFIERFDSAIISIGTGEIIPEVSFDLKNPLLVVPVN